MLAEDSGCGLMGLRSHQGPGGRTLPQLRNEARQRGAMGRSAMNKAQLEADLTR